MRFLRQCYQDVWGSRLSRRVAAWVFMSLICVEGVVLIPSYFNRRHELFIRKEQVSKELLGVIQQSQIQGEDLKPVFDRLGRDLQFSTIIKGGALYTNTGQPLSQFGEAIELQIPARSSRDQMSRLLDGGKRYEIAWLGNHFNHQYILVIRHDTSDIGLDLLAYVGRILVSVFVISVVVTGTTLVIVTFTIITPFLKLRDDFDRVVDAIRQTDAAPCFETLNSMQFKCQMNQRIPDEMTEVFHAFQQMFERIFNEVKQRQMVETALRQEQEKADKLLLNILPASIAHRLKEEEGAIAEKFDSVTILFADLVNFTHLSTQIMPVELVELLNNIFSRFDELTEKYQLEKIKTIGDAYMVVGGIPTARNDHASAIARLALEMQIALAQLNQQQHQQFELRIGIHTGPVVAGVIGRRKFAYDLWGDTVNIASRMESHGIPGKIQVTAATYHLLKEDFVLDYRGCIAVKGRGELDTYFLGRVIS